jgi:hypothetical protein
LPLLLPTRAESDNSKIFLVVVGRTCTRTAREEPVSCGSRCGGMGFGANVVVFLLGLVAGSDDTSGWAEI